MLLLYTAIWLDQARGPLEMRRRGACLRWLGGGYGGVSVWSVVGGLPAWGTEERDIYEAAIILCRFAPVFSHTGCWQRASPSPSDLDIKASPAIAAPQRVRCAGGRVATM